MPEGRNEQQQHMLQGWWVRVHHWGSLTEDLSLNLATWSHWKKQSYGAESGTSVGMREQEMKGQQTLSTRPAIKQSLGNQDEFGRECGVQSVLWFILFLIYDICMLMGMIQQTNKKFAMQEREGTIAGTVSLSKPEELGSRREEEGLVLGDSVFGSASVTHEREHLRTEAAG